VESSQQDYILWVSDMFLSAWEEEQILKKRILSFSQNTGKPNNIP
jgi:hypothetical protein